MYLRIALRLSMLWGAFALALGGCSANEPVGGNSCVSSQQRCDLTDFGFVFQKCDSDNHLLTFDVCSANQVCDENLGCIESGGQECEPSQALCNGTCTQISSDPNNCGSCGNSCLVGAVHANWSCKANTCVFGGCQPGYYDLDGDKQCEYACTFVSAAEACNGVDDNCNGLIDESVSTPSPTQVCGVSPAAKSAECTIPAVKIACNSGAWKCTFPPGVCSPTCATAVEIVDKLDNDCDGLVDEP